jgi:hypothetical protein
MPVAGKNDVKANPRFSSRSDFSLHLAHNIGSPVVSDSEILTAYAGKTRVPALNSPTKGRFPDRPGICLLGQIKFPVGSKTIPCSVE